MTIQELKKKIIPTLEKEQVVKAGVFGSVARGEAKEGSDVDILIQFEEGSNKSLFDILGLKVALEDILRRKVDLVEYSAIRPLLKNIILKQQVTIL